MNDDDVKTWSDGRRALFALGLVGMVWSVLWFPFNAPGRHWEMLISASASFLLVLLPALGPIGMLRIGTVELNKAAEQAVAEANASVEEVRSLALAFSGVMLNVVAYDGVWGGMDAALKVLLRDEVRQTLRNLKVAPATIDKTTDICDAVLRHAYARLLQNAAKRAAAADQAKAFEVDRLLEPLADLSTFTTPHPAKVRKIITEHGVVNTEVDDLLGDYEHFWQTREVRRIDVLRGVR